MPEPLARPVMRGVRRDKISEVPNKSRSIGAVMEEYTIPTEATEIIKENFETGEIKSTEYYLNNKRIALRYRHKNGQIDYEAFFKDDQYHGPQREWYENGQLMWESFYENGREHGIAKQWNEGGELLGTYTMHYGTGTDHWWDSEGWLAEEHQCKDGYPHGAERWWLNRDQLYSERYWKEGELHGIWREWNSKGKLSRGYPQYYVNGTKVSKKKYLKSCLVDSSLIGFDEKDNLPGR